MDEFAFWREAMAGKSPQIHADSPQPGYYKKRAHKGGPWLPVAIWHRNGTLVARVAGDTVDPLDVWTWCASNPVSKEVAKRAFETGTWEGDAPTVGDNSGDVGPLDLLKDYIETARAWFSKAGKIASQKAVDTAANYAAEISRLKSDADKDRDSKVRPHLEAQREINGEYKPVIEEADSLAKEIKRACDAFLIAEKFRLEAEARKKYEAERAAAEAEWQKLGDVAEPELPIAPPEPVKVSAGGQRGRKMGLRKETLFSVADFDAVYAWAKDNPKAREAIEKIAIQAARAGVDVPGIEKQEVERAA